MRHATRALPAALAALLLLSQPAAALAATDDGPAMPVVSADPEREELDDLAARQAGALPDGTYALLSALGDGSALATGDDGSPTLDRDPRPETAGWSVAHDADGYVIVTSAATGQALGAASATAAAGGRVTLSPASGSRAQRWVAVPEGGGIVLVSALDRDLVLDAAGGTLRLGTHDGSSGQVWSPVDPALLAGGSENGGGDDALLAQAVPAGTYYLSSALGTDRLLMVSGGQNGGSGVLLAASNGSSEQRWKISYDDEGYATVVNERSGLALGVSGVPASGSGVLLAAPDGSLSQKWLVESLGSGAEDGFRLRPVLGGGLALDASGGGLRVSAASGSSAQTFSIVSPSQLAEPVSGTYQIRITANAAQVIDVANDSSANGANIQACADNGGTAQIWDVWRRDDGTYLIKNAASGKALDVAGGAAAAGANVQLWQKTGGAAQAWTITYDRKAAGYRIASALDPSLVLTVAGTAASGSNVSISPDAGASTQRFLLDEASYTPPILNTVSWVGARWYTEGREGNDWTALVIHISECTTLSAVDNTFLGTSQTSAHFGVSDSEIHQYVSLDDTAWAVGNWTWNTRTVSIEHVGTTSWPPSRATLDRSAQLMAALARLRQWPELVVGENVGVHKWYSATSCPATLDVTYLVSKANEYMGNGFTYKSVEGGAAKPTFAAMAVAPAAELA